MTLPQLHIDPEIVADLDAEVGELRREVIRLSDALEKIACRHVTVEPLWWQVEARKALDTDQQIRNPESDHDTPDWVEDCMDWRG
jgi:hypothetical protein